MMLASVLTVVLGLVTVVSSAPLALLKPRATCYSGAYIIGARGSDEDVGFGTVSSVVTALLAAIPNSGSIALVYPASVIDPLYDDSVTDGINAMAELIETYVAACGSSSKIVLTGFSQGANVITDLLAGGVLKPDPIAPSYVDYIKGVAVFGDPTFTYGQTFNVGTDTTTNGIFARSEGGSSLALLNTYAAKIRSYCDIGDVYCASGDDSTAHAAEVPTWGPAAVTFIAGLV